MDSRYIDLQQVLEGYERTGAPLVAIENGQLAAAAPADDVGIFYFIPEIVRNLGVGLDDAITIFFLAIIAVSFLIGIAGCLFWLKKPVMRLIAGIALASILYITMKNAGIYVISSCTVVLAVPLYMYFLKQDKMNVSFYIFLVLSGFILGLAHIIRAHSGTAVIIFILVSMWLSWSYAWKAKSIATSLLLIGIILPMLWFNLLISQRDTYLVTEIPGYISAPTTHTFWHQAYISMGYIPNEYGIVYEDICAHERALEIDPEMEYRSEHYSEILKGEVLRIAKDDPGFIAKLLIAKILKMLLRLIMFANIGLIAAFLRPKSLNIELGFWLAIGFGSLFGILTIPWSAYILSFIAMCVMYALASLEHYFSSPPIPLSTRCVAPTD